MSRVPCTRLLFVFHRAAQLRELSATAVRKPEKPRQLPSRHGELPSIGTASDFRAKLSRLELVKVAEPVSKSLRLNRFHSLARKVIYDHSRADWQAHVHLKDVGARHDKHKAEVRARSIAGHCNGWVGWARGCPPLNL